MHKFIKYLSIIFLFVAIPVMASVTSIQTLKNYFETGDKPTQTQFSTLIDSLFIGTSTDGYILQTNGTGWDWVSTSSLGFSDASFSTTSADYWVSTKGYLTNLLGGLNAILGNSTTTNATTTNLAITGLATPAGAFLAVNPNGLVISTTTPTGGTGTPGGSNTYVQYNDGGVLGGDSGFVYSKVDNELTVSNSIVSLDSITASGGGSLSTDGLRVFSGKGVKIGYTGFAYPVPTNSGVIIEGNVGIGTTTNTYSLQIASSTATSTLALGYATTTAISAGRSQMCWWNGDNWTIEYYPPNSVTKVVATSTNCN
jgi:hypothetical protein